MLMLSKLAADRKQAAALDAHILAIANARRRLEIDTLVMDLLPEKLAAVLIPSLVTTDYRRPVQRYEFGCYLGECEIDYDYAGGVLLTHTVRATVKDAYPFAGFAHTARDTTDNCFIPEHVVTAVLASTEFAGKDKYEIEDLLKRTEVVIRWFEEDMKKVEKFILTQALTQYEKLVTSTTKVGEHYRKPRADG